MSTPGQQFPNAFALVMGIQLVALGLALAGLLLTGTEVTLLGATGYASILYGALGALLTYGVALWVTRSDSAAGAALRHHCAVLYTLFARFNWMQITLAAAAAGICEELLFRGFLQPWVAQLSSPLWGIVAASVIFGLLHAASLTYFIATLIVGLLLGVTYWLTQSFLLVAVWHGLYDLFAIAALVKYPHSLGVPLSPRD